jgi:hypothetical protein
LGDKAVGAVARATLSGTLNAGGLASDEAGGHAAKKQRRGMDSDYSNDIAEALRMFEAAGS